MTKQGDAVRARLKKRFPRIEGPAPFVELSGGRAWVRVEAPRPWRPTLSGEELVGELVSRSTRPGDGGKVYGVVTLRTAEGTRTVSGVVVTGLFEAAGCPDGSTVRLVYLGERKATGSGYSYRDFELFLARDELP